MKKNSNEWKKQERLFKHEGLVLLIRSELLKDKTIKICLAMEKFGEEYSDEAMEKLSWEEKEEAYKKCEELGNMLKENEAMLMEIEEVYNNLMGRVNEFYGREVMKKFDESPTFLLGDDSHNDNDGGDDWWKT